VTKDGSACGGQADDSREKQTGWTYHGIETINTITDRQTAAKVRQYFQENGDEKGQL